jgi:hypothetical protein
MNKVACNYTESEKRNEHESFVHKCPDIENNVRLDREGYEEKEDAESRNFEF